MAKYSTFGQYLLKCREAAGIATQADLAARMEVSQQSVSRWEAGGSRPRSPELLKLAAVLMVDVGELTHAAGYAPKIETTVSFDRPLPLPALPPESFELFCLDFLASYFRGTGVVHPAGKTGHKQYGIDIEVRLESDENFTYQCKREAQFGPAQVKDAIKKQTLAATKKFIMLSRVASPEARKEVERAPGWDILDQTDISRMFRELPKVEQIRIVDIFFPGKRFELLGVQSAGPWQTVRAFFAPLMVATGMFNHHWDLIGRQSELEQLQEAFDDPDVVVVSLCGRAGEGKSRVLRSALDLFAAKHPEVRVLVAAPTEEINAKAVEDLGHGKKLVVVDDVHDRSDMEQLIRHAAKPGTQTRLLLVHRPYWRDVIKHDLARIGLSGNLVKSVTLQRPTKADGIALAKQVLEKNGAPTDAAEQIGEMAYDSPLAVVFGAYIVAKEGMHPQMFATHEEFHSAVYKRYEKAIAQSVAQGTDLDLVHKILRVLALTQPIVPDDVHLQRLLKTIEDVEAPNATRLIRRLIDAGVLFKRGLKYRLSPDLLADSIIESGCISHEGKSNGYVERLFEASIPEFKEHVLLNLGRLDWRRNDGDTSASNLLDGIWSNLEWENDYDNADVKAAAAAAYFQPRQTLQFARRLVAEGHGQDDEVCRMIRRAAYHPNFLDDASKLLWECAKNDARPTNQHPQHPIRLLTELAAPEPEKPVEFMQNTVSFALFLLDYPESWTRPYTPFEIMKGALATDGHVTSSSSMREIIRTHFNTNAEAVSSVRQQVITAMLESLVQPNKRRAMSAAKYLGDAVRGPMNPDLTGDDAWGKEFQNTLERLLTLIGSKHVPAPVLVQVAESIHWHACYATERTMTPAVEILKHLDRDFHTRAVRVMMDVWGTNTWDISPETGRGQFEADKEALCSDLLTQFPEPQQLEQFLHDCLEDIQSYVGNTRYSFPQLFVAELCQKNLRFAWHIVDTYANGDRSHLSEHVGRALGVLLTAEKAKAIEVMNRMIEADAENLLVVAEAYYVARNLAPYTDQDCAILKQIFSSKVTGVLFYAAEMLREIVKHDEVLANMLLMSMDVPLAMKASRGFFVEIGREGSILFKRLQDDQLRVLIHSLREVKRLDDYWLAMFLKNSLQRAPIHVLTLAMKRIEDSLADGDRYKEALPRSVRETDSMNLMSHKDGKVLLELVLDWGLERVDVKGFLFHLTEFVRSLCSPYGEAFASVLEQWCAKGDERHYRIAAAVLQKAGSQFIFEHEAFIARILKASRGIGEEAHKELSSAMFLASVTGMRMGTPGMPFGADVRLREMAEQRMSTLTKHDPTYELYMTLVKQAQRDIDMQIEQGRLMDAQDEEG